MRKYRNSLLVLLCLTFLSFVLAVANPFAKEGNGQPVGGLEVKVANTVENPVPTTVEGGELIVSNFPEIQSVDVTNTTPIPIRGAIEVANEATNPVPVVLQGEPSKESFMMYLFGRIEPGESYAIDNRYFVVISKNYVGQESTSPFVVPAGKRLHIEYISVRTQYQGDLGVEAWGTIKITTDHLLFPDDPDEGFVHMDYDIGHLDARSGRFSILPERHLGKRVSLVAEAGFAVNFILITSAAQEYGEAFWVHLAGFLVDAP